MLYTYNTRTSTVHLISELGQLFTTLWKRTDAVSTTQYSVLCSGTHAEAVIDLVSERGPVDADVAAHLHGKVDA